MGESISKTHEWRKVQDFMPGDFIHRWGDDLEVISVTSSLPFVTVTYKDGNKTTEFDSMYDKQYIARKRDVPLDVVDEEAQRALFERMLPPVVYSKDEDPEQVAKRVIRHAEEWSE